MPERPSPGRSSTFPRFGAEGSVPTPPEPSVRATPAPQPGAATNADASEVEAMLAAQFGENWRAPWSSLRPLDLSTLDAETDAVSAPTLTALSAWWSVDDAAPAPSHELALEDDPPPPSMQRPPSRQPPPLRPQPIAPSPEVSTPEPELVLDLAELARVTTADAAARRKWPLWYAFAAAAFVALAAALAFAAATNEQRASGHATPIGNAAALPLAPAPSTEPEMPALGVPALSAAEPVSPRESGVHTPEPRVLPHPSKALTPTKAVAHEKRDYGI